MSKIIKFIKEFKKSHPDWFEFFMFKLMGNVATVANFTVLWISTGFIFASFKNIQFDWWIFHYDIERGGLCGFLSFLLAYICSQIVNFIVQRKVVFGANINVSRVIHWYILTITVAGLISIWLPPYVIAYTESYVGVWAPSVANCVNIFFQVVINYPMLKFVIMRRVI